MQRLSACFDLSSSSLKMSLSIVLVLMSSITPLWRIYIHNVITFCNFLSLKSQFAPIGVLDWLGNQRGCDYIETVKSKWINAINYCSVMNKTTQIKWMPSLKMLTQKSLKFIKRSPIINTSYLQYLARQSLYVVTLNVDQIFETIQIVSNVSRVFV